MRSKLISLVVASIGRVAEVERLLSSLTQQTDDNFEVILVDQNSDARLKSVVHDARSGGLAIKHLRLDIADQYKARTAGIEAAQGEYIAFPDDDCWYDEAAIENCLQGFAETKANCIIAHWPDKYKSPPSELRQLTLNEVRGFRSVGPSMITQFYEKKTVLQAGGFDSRIGLGRWFGGGEDTDLLFTVLGQGKKVVIVPSVIVRHKFESELKVPPDLVSLKSRARGTGALYAKHKISFWVIVRGLLAPIMKPIFFLQGVWALRSGYAVCMGRLEGYMKWKFGVYEKTFK